jgi:hypothetical protein
MRGESWSGLCCTWPIWTSMTSTWLRFLFTPRHNPSQFLQTKTQYDACNTGFRQSLCHWWASGPTAWLSSEPVPGITPLEPGCKLVSIAPQLGNLEWAEGDFPTPHGAIHVRHDRQADGTILSKITVPPGVKVNKVNEGSSVRIEATSRRPDWYFACVPDLSGSRWINGGIRRAKPTPGCANMWARSSPVTTTTQRSGSGNSAMNKS